MYLSPAAKSQTIPNTWWLKTSMYYLPVSHFGVLGPALGAPGGQGSGPHARGPLGAREPRGFPEAAGKPVAEARLGGTASGSLTACWQALVLCHLGISPGLPHVMMSNSRRKQ